MHWIIQENLFQTNERNVILDILQRFAISHQLVSVTADRKLDPEVDHHGPIMVNGSVLLSQIARERGWYPGAWINDNFSYAVWQSKYGDHVLNRNGVITTIGDADPPLDEFFIRPIADTKTFSGCVMKRSEFATWKTKYPAETAIVCAPPVKIIGQEYRHFIIDGRVISSSRYKLGKRFDQSSLVDTRISEFATEMARLWQPSRAFVLDTYVTHDKMGIVELGGICHAGFYAADVQKIIMTLDQMDEDGTPVPDWPESS